MPERTYTEKEVAALLERAAALQAQARRSGAHQPGLTLAELEAVAADAGLDPALLRQAAREIEASGAPPPGAGADASATHVFSERWAPGELTEEAWEDIVVELRHRFDTDLGGVWGMPGYGESRVEAVGRTRTWKHTSLSGIETRLMLRPREDGVHVRLSQRVGWGSPLAESATYGTVLAFVFAALALGASHAAAAVVLVLTLAAAIPLILLADRAWRRKKHRELEALADRVAALAAGPNAPLHAPPASQALQADEPPRAVPALDASLLRDAAAEAAPGRSSSGRSRVHKARE